MLAVYSSSSALWDILDMGAGLTVMSSGFCPLVMPWVLRRLLVAGGSVEVVDALMMLCSEMLLKICRFGFPEHVALIFCSRCEYIWLLARRR
jgi:hypothetical protein